MTIGARYVDVFKFSSIDLNSVAGSYVHIHTFNIYNSLISPNASYDDDDDEFYSCTKVSYHNDVLEILP